MYLNEKCCGMIWKINGVTADCWVQFLRNFEWTLVDPTHPWNSACYAIFFITDMWVRVTERKKYPPA